MCSVWTVVHYFLTAYVFVLFFYALMSWVPSIRARWNDFVPQLVEPVLQPVRRIIPPLGGFDLSFLIVIFVLQIVNQQIVGPHLFYCA
jgi:YggT family protein